MINTVFKPRRRNRDGKLVINRLYRGRYRLEGDFAVTEVALNTTDKLVAQKLLDEIIREAERERAGIIAPRLQRISAEKPLTEHLKEYAADLTIKGRTEKHIRFTSGCIKKVIKECGWQFPKSVTADAFVGWRSRQKLAPKTLNEYQHSVNALLNWMVKQQRIAFNPLAQVEKADVRGRQQRRRPFSDEEFRKLLAEAGDYYLLYLTAAYTGLRLGELLQLLWLDIRLDHARPHIISRDSTTKNRKQAMAPLHPLLIPELQKAKANAKGGDHVFPQYRHSDPRLTANLYTDANSLPTFAAVAALPWFDPEAGAGLNDTQTDPQNFDFSGPGQSWTVTTKTNDTSLQVVDKADTYHALARPVTGRKWLSQMVAGAGIEPAT